MNFKGLQLIISERIGISPHQFSIFLVSREKRGSRIPVAAKTNFSKIYREKDWLFLVALKSSWRERRIKGHEMMTGNTVRSRFDPQPGNLMLLRRDDNSVAINGNGLPGLDLGRVGSSMRDELVWTPGFVGVFTMLLLSGFGHQRVRLHGPLKDLLERRFGSMSGIELS